MSDIPKPEDLDAAWFTGCLRAAGHQDAQVAAVSRTQIGTGQIGRCFRYELELRGGDGNTPGSLVGKFPSEDPLSRQTGVSLRNYYREVSFYQHVAPELSISLPRCYHSAIDGEGPEFVLVLEDMRPAQPGDQIRGCGADVARAAVLELVGLQAPSWCRDDLARYDWLAGGEPEVSFQDLYAQLLVPFLDRYGGRLAGDERRILAAVAEAPQCPLFQPAGDVFCLEHVDYRLDNMLIDTAPAPHQRSPRVTVVDWQSVRLGKPLNDVAYFLGAGMQPEARRAVERDIVADYHRGLQAAGVRGFDWAQCWEDFRRGTFAGFGVTVIASMIVEQTPRGDEMFTVMARRHARHALDHGAEEFLR